MDVYIGNITRTTTLNDVIQHFKGFAKKARIRMVDKQLEDGTRAFFAVAEFDTEKLALKAIKKLNGSQLGGQQLYLREFYHRSYSNERRAVNWRDKPWDGPERRVTERRRKPRMQQRDDFEDLLENAKQNEQRQQEETEQGISISAYDNMARKF